MSAELDNTTNTLPSSVDASEQSAELRTEDRTDVGADATASVEANQVVSGSEPVSEQAPAAPAHEAVAPVAPAEASAPNTEAEPAKTTAPAAGAEESKDTEGEEFSHEAMGELIEKYPTPQGEAVAEHKPIEGRVVAISELGVFVDIGAKNEGLIPAQEFSDNASGPLPGYRPNGGSRKARREKGRLRPALLPAPAPPRDVEEN